MSKSFKQEWKGGKGFMYYLLRWPLLLFIGFILLIELILYILVRQWVRLWEKTSYLSLYLSNKSIRRAHHKLEQSTSFKEWKENAKILDTLQGKDEWKQAPRSRYYDMKVIQKTISQLRESRMKRDLEKLKKYLRSACKANLGGVENYELYSFTHYGTKKLVEEYISEVLESLDYLETYASKEDQKHIYRILMKAFGRTALCLSGGAGIFILPLLKQYIAMAYYHLGVIKCLHENSVLPTVISGTSGGALIAAFVGVRTDEELNDELKPDYHHEFSARDGDETIWYLFCRFLREGVIFDKNRWERRIQWLTKGTTTFLEAYQKTGRILNITVVAEKSHSPPTLLNYKTAPNVVIYSAVLASSAINPLIEPVELLSKNEDGIIEPFHGMGKRWRDGSFKTDIPISSLHQLLNVNFTVVSQVNPHIVLFFYDARGDVGNPSKHRQGGGWRGGFVASSLENFLKLDMKKWLYLLKNLDLLPTMLGQDPSQLFLQKFYGNITIRPKPSIEDYLTLVSNPTFESLQRKIIAGEKYTWPKICMVSNRMKIEKELFKKEFLLKS